MSDWNRGFGALVPLGDFEGGDLLIGQLGLGIKGVLCLIYSRRGLVRPIKKGGKDFLISLIKG
jgi:hypothetical protein